MNPSARLGDIGSGHASFPPTPIIAASGDTSVNSLPSARILDPLAPHGSPSPSPPHGRVIAVGSTSVSINSRAAARITDPISCGGLIVTGSGNTFKG